MQIKDRKEKEARTGRRYRSVGLLRVALGLLAPPPLFTSLCFPMSLLARSLALRRGCDGRPCPGVNRLVSLAPCAFFAWRRRACLRVWARQQHGRGCDEIWGGGRAECLFFAPGRPRYTRQQGRSIAPECPPPRQNAPSSARARSLVCRPRQPRRLGLTRRRVKPGGAGQT